MTKSIGTPPRRGRICDFFTDLLAYRDRSALSFQINDRDEGGYRALYEAPLVLAGRGPAVGNDLGADGMTLVMMTGANEGGKSTFLRAVGAAQLMMQAGMFVCAEYYSATICDGLHTHFKREEDAALRSGKLDEELARMSTIAGHLHPGSMVLFNESFAATNEREGSSISRDVIAALTEAGVRVFFVTHLYDLAHSLFDMGLPNALFLQAERRPDGQRTFRLCPGEPTRTSYGEDLYSRIFAVQRPETAWSGEEQVHPVNVRLAGS